MLLTTSFFFPFLPSTCQPECPEFFRCFFISVFIYSQGNFNKLSLSERINSRVSGVCATGDLVAFVPKTKKYPYLPFFLPIFFVHTVPPFCLFSERQSTEPHMKAKKKRHLPITAPTHTPTVCTLSQSHGGFIVVFF